MSTRRRQLHDQARALRAEGLRWVDIAERMGVSRSYASEVFHDPDGSAVNERKDRTRGTCADCGGATSWAKGGETPERCDPCHRASVAVPCGTRGSYARGCRCAECRAANAAWQREYRARRAAA